jgi:hypothetical protein
LESSCLFRQCHDEAGAVRIGGVELDVASQALHDGVGYGESEEIKGTL